jgi:hypothetical protein
MLIKQYNDLMDRKSEQKKSLKKIMKGDEDLGLYTD